MTLSVPQAPAAHNKPSSLCCLNLNAQSGLSTSPAPGCADTSCLCWVSRACPAPTQSPALEGSLAGAGAGTQSRIPQIHGDCTDPWGMHSWLYFLVLQALPASPSPFPADDPWVSSADLPLLFTASVSVPSLPNSNSLFQTPWEAQGIPNLLKSQAWRYWKLLGC